MSESLRRFRAARLVEAVRQQREQEAATQPGCVDCSDADGDGQQRAETAAPGDVVVSGLAVPYDEPTGDGRMIAAGALTWDLDEEGIPLIWDRAEGDHTGTVLGRVDEMHADDTGVYVDSARLFASNDEESAAAVARVVELIGENSVGWSVGLDDIEAEATFRDPPMTENPDGSVTVKFTRDAQIEVVTSARIRHLAIVDTPAFPGARPVLGVEPIVAAGGTAVATYRAEFFQPRATTAEPTPLTVTPEGQVFGAVAGPGCYRDGQGKHCRTYQRDPDPELRNFHTSSVTLDDGSTLRVGVITAGGLHAPLNVDLKGQRQHRENSQTAWAVVRAYEDSFGRLNVAGQVIPGLDPGFVNQAAACSTSVEKWPVYGQQGLTLAGILSVPTPAFPVI